MIRTAEHADGATIRPRQHADVDPAWRVARLVKGAVVRAVETERLVLARCDEARRAIEEERQEAERAAALAHDEAVAAGLERGAEALANALAALETQRLDIAASLPVEILDAAVALAEAMLRERIEESPSRWIAVLEPVIARLQGRRTVVLVADPCTATQIASLREKLVSLLPGVETLEVVTDCRATAGSIRVDTEVGSFATSVRSRLDAMGAALLDSEELS